MMDAQAQRLVRCLRDTATMRTLYPVWLLSEMEQAADLIEAQAAEILKLREQLRDLQEMGSGRGNDVDTGCVGAVAGLDSNPPKR
jgi:hypothetical protein